MARQSIDELDNSLLARCPNDAPVMQMSKFAVVAMREPCRKLD